MELIRIAALLVLATCGTPVAAQTVYRCTTGETYAYQDQPCAADQVDAGTHTIVPSPGGAVPPAVADLMDAAAKRTDAARAAAAQPTSQPAPNVTAPAYDRRTGYRCTVEFAGEWAIRYQYAPCAPMMQAGTYVATAGIPDPTATPGYRTDVLALPIYRRTAQKEITARQACEGMQSQIDPYERYKRRNPCKGM